MRKTFKITGMSILGLIGLISVYMISTYCLSRITVTEEKGNKQEVTIYIKTNGVHTDLVVPIRTNQMDWSKEVSFSNTLSADTTFTYLAMGWGDKGFYLETPTWADLKTSVAFKAATGLSTTAIHATYYPVLKEDSDCVKIKISREQYARLIKYIDDSFRKDDNGHVINIKTNANYGKTDAFYEAKGRYSLFHTCNSWANAGLKACGQRACLWTAFDTGIFLKYK
jgi:uncharacterized protein (TIGR02117 family)